MTSGQKHMTLYIIFIMMRLFEKKKRKKEKNSTTVELPELMLI